MAIYFFTSTPKKLLRIYRKACDDGHVKTWSYDQDGDFSHIPEQWSGKAWLRPSIEEGKTLTFNILRPSETELNVSTYAVYHGRFIESMMEHCDELFKQASATAAPAEGDIV